MPGAYLVNAANDMYRIVSEDGERTPEQVAEVAKIGGNALKRVRDDPEFRREVLEASQEWRGNIEAAQAMLGAHGESQEQLDSFLYQERAVLDTAGLESGLAEELIVQGREVAGRAREWKGDQNDIFKNVDQLHDRASGLSTQLKVAQDVAKALNTAITLNVRLATELEPAHAYNLAVVEELSSARRENLQLVGQLAAAQQTSQDLINQLANTGLQRPSRVKTRIFWRLTFGVGGLVMVYANTAATPLIGPPASAASCAIGNVLMGIAAVMK